MLSEQACVRRQTLIPSLKTVDREVFKTKRNVACTAEHKIRILLAGAGYRLKTSLTLKEVNIIPGVSCKRLQK